MSIHELKEVFDVYTQETHHLMSEGMGSTIAGLFVYHGKVFRFHAGDSRIYLLRDGGLRRLTIDHSLKESGGNPDAPSNIITNALGGGDIAFIEFEEIDQPLLNNDIYLLSSDGLHDLVPPGVISDTLIIPDSAEKLLTLAKENGGNDNISIITIKIQVIDKVIPLCYHNDIRYIIRRINMATALKQTTIRFNDTYTRSIAEKAAAMQGQSLSAFIMSAVREYGEKVIHERTQAMQEFGAVALSQRDYAALMDSLANTPKPSKTFREAMKRYKKSGIEWK